MDNGKNPIQSAERIFQVLEQLSEMGEAGLMEVSVALNLNKSTAHRMLNSLIYMGYVVQDKESLKYKLSYKILLLAGRLLDKMDILPIVKPILKKLMNNSNETVHFTKREGNELIYIDKIESDTNSIRMVSQIGMRRPVYCTGMGKAMLALMPEEKVKEIWDSSDIIKLTEKTIISWSKMKKELIKVRKLGYAIDDEENELGVRCIAAAITDFNKEPVGAFSISAPVSRMDEESIKRLSSLILESKKDICKLLYMN